MNRPSTIAAITSLALLGSQSSEAADQATPTASDMIAVAGCIQRNTSNTLRVMGQSTEDAREYSWELKEGVELRFRHQARDASGELIERTFTLGDSNLDGTLNALEFGDPVTTESQSLFNIAVQDTLNVCGAEPRSEQNICPGVWSIGERQRYKLAKGMVQKVVALPHTDGQMACTGSVLKDDRILTAAHCLEGIGEPLRVAVPLDGAAYKVHLVPAAVLNVDRYNDLALLQIPKKTTQESFRIAKKMSKEEMVYTMGHGGEYGWIFTTLPRPQPSGDSLFDARGRNFSYPIPFCAEPGLSGGPVVDAKGELIGVFKQLAADAQIRFTGVSIPLEVVRGFLDKPVNEAVVPSGEAKTCTVAYTEEDRILKPDGRYMQKKYIVDKYCE